jgi:putative FmdB family regulatory protein
MPTYEYQCDACQHKFELFQSIKADPVRKCPECGKVKVRRLVSGGGGIIFKGSGFYCTDYRSDGYKTAAKAAKSDSPSSSSAKTDSSSKADSAPAKSESKPNAAQ